MASFLLDRSAYQEPDLEILDFYKTKLEKFSLEHQQLLQKVEGLSSGYSRIYKLELETSERKDEVLKLQRLVSHSQNRLVEEQRHILKLQAENDRFRVKEIEDRDYIAQLVQTIQQQKNSTNYPTSLSTFQFNFKPKEERNQGSDDLELQNRTLKLKVLALEAQLEEQGSNYRAMLDNINNDRQALLEEETQRRNSDQVKLQRLSQDLQRAQIVAINNLSELVELRRTDKQKEMQILELELRYKQEVKRIDYNCSTARANSNINETYHNQSNFSINGSSFYGLRDKGRKLQSQIRPSIIGNANSSQLRQLNSELKSKEKEVTNLKIEIATTNHQTEKAIEAYKQRIQLLQNRADQKDQAHRFGLEGMYYDMKQMQTELKKIEHQLLKQAKTFSDEELSVIKQVQKLFQKVTGMVNSLKKG